jgi:hypothetical protein
MVNANFLYLLAMRYFLNNLLFIARIVIHLMILLVRLIRKYLIRNKKVIENRKKLHL